jgi:hypothetical protein
LTLTARPGGGARLQATVPLDYGSAPVGHDRSAQSL